MNEDQGVTSVWVKYYDGFGRCWEDHGLATVAEARAKYKRLLTDQSTVFAQFGARTVDGSIVLGEYRNHEEMATKTCPKCSTPTNDRGIDSDGGFHPGMACRRIIADAKAMAELERLSNEA